MSASAIPNAAKREHRGSVLDVLQALLSEGRREEILALVSKVVARNTELERLLLQAKSQGKKSEGVSSAQLTLLLDGLPANTNTGLKEADEKLRSAAGSFEDDEAKKKRRARRGRKPLPEHLRRVENVIPVPQEQRACPVCGKERACIGHDVSEVVDLIPAEVVVRVDKREKLACGDCEGELVRAPLGDKVVSSGRMGTSLVAHVLVEKYRDGLPLSRQVERFERLGLELSISTLADQVAWATDALRPLWNAAMDKVLASTVLHLDATGLPVLDRTASGGIRTGSIWGYVGSDISDAGVEHTALCLYASTGKRYGQKNGELGPGDVLAKRTGFVVADASSIFDEAFKREGLVECGCNMHGRRYFKRALAAGDTRAALPIAAFKRLYRIERELKTATIQQRLVARQERSKPVYNALIAWTTAYQGQEPPSSGLGKAIQYLLNHELALRRYLDSGVIPIDNGVVERLHIRTALTRKNFLFAGSDAGGERAAIAFTLLGCCKLAEVDPVAYLTDVLPRLAVRKLRLNNIAQLLPAAWKRARAAHFAAEA
jgi:transposase